MKFNKILFFVTLIFNCNFESTIEEVKIEKSNLEKIKPKVRIKFKHKKKKLKPTVLLIMGPSCSGKSTISRNLLNKLKNWKFVGFDNVKIVGKNVTLCQRFDEMTKEANKYLDEGDNIIIDTNTHNQSKLEKLHSKNIKKILVYSPLEVLLKRHDARVKNIHQDECSAKNRRNFVTKSFNNFFINIKPNNGKKVDTNLYSTMPCDLIVDTNKKTRNENIDMILEFICNKI